MSISIIKSSNRLIETLSFQALFTALSLLFFAGSLSELKAQWSGNPESNRKLINETTNPVNISVINDAGRGFYLLWQEKDAGTGDIYFQHLNYDGNPSISGNGVKINGGKASLDAPQAALGVNNTLLVVWKEIVNESHQFLSLQRYKSNGFKFWTGTGIKVNEHVEEIMTYAVNSDSSGAASVCFIEKSPLPKASYNIKCQRISLNGYADYPEDGIEVVSSPALKSNLQIIPAFDGGLLIFWVESKNRSNVINVKYLDKRGRVKWTKSGRELLSADFNLLNYKVVLVPNRGFHLTWTSMNSKNSIYHQLFDFNGSSLWQGANKIVKDSEANLSSPQVCVTNDGAIVFGWVSEKNNRREIKLTRYNSGGAATWKEDRQPYAPDNASNNFGLSLIPDERGGVVAAWFRKNAGEPRTSIYAQRIGTKSELLWGETGIAIAKNPKSEKSYLNIIPDSYSGIVALFKESETNRHGIFGQRIFSNKTYSSQISEFRATQRNDSVLLSWAVMNETGVQGYRVERTVIKEKDEESVWSEIGEVKPRNLNITGRYNFADNPLEQGTYIYRVVQLGGFGDLNVSNTSRIDYFPERSDRVFVVPGQQLVFGDSSLITFNLPEPADVTIELFNSRLEKLEEFTLTDVNAGINRFYFYSRKYPQGVYYYRFKTGDFLDVKKLVISRSGWR